MANLVILNLFLALLLSSFADMGGDPEEDGEPDKMKIAFNRIGRFIDFINPKNVFKRLCKRKKVMDINGKPMVNGTSNGVHRAGIPNDFHDKNGYATDIPTSLPNPGGKEELINNFQKQIGQDMDLGKKFYYYN